MTPAEMRLFARLLAVAHGRLTKAGHAAIVVTTESRGLCGSRWPKTCGPTCIGIMATIREAEAFVAAHAEAPEPRQLELLKEAS